jgi:hypothetical protein
MKVAIQLSEISPEAVLCSEISAGVSHFDLLPRFRVVVASFCRENDELDSSKAQVSGLMTNRKVLSLLSFSLGGTIVERDHLNSNSMTRWEASETFQLKFRT